MTDTARSRGFTIIEILVATMLVGVALISTSWAMSSAARSKVVLEDRGFEAAMLAREIHEMAQSLPREPSGVVGVSKGADVEALDSLVGAVFSPPVRADGQTLSSKTGWSQSVDVKVCCLDDPSVKTDEALKGLSKNEEKLYQLEVTVSYDGAAVDTFSWWLAP